MINDDWSAQFEGELRRKAIRLKKKSQEHAAAESMFKYLSICTSIPTIIMSSLIQIKPSNIEKSSFKSFLDNIPLILGVLIPLKEYLGFSKSESTHSKFAKDYINLAEEIISDIDLTSRSYRLPASIYTQKLKDKETSLLITEPGIPCFTPIFEQRRILCKKRLLKNTFSDSDSEENSSDLDTPIRLR